MVHFALFPPSGGSDVPPTAGQGESVWVESDRDEEQVSVVKDEADEDELDSNSKKRRNNNSTYLFLPFFKISKTLK